jgi:hypothetical protein
MVVFDHMMDGKPHTMRVAYHFDGDQFMFGKPVGVKPTVVYMPETDDDEERKPDNAYSDRYENVEKPEYVEPKAGCSCGSKTDDSIESFFDDAWKAIESIDLEQKAGRVISGGNLEKLTRAMELLQEVIAAGGRTEIEMKEKSANISANIDDLFAVKQILEPIFEFHKLDAKANEFGIEIKGLISDDAVTAINRALSNFDYDAELVTEDDSAES